LLAFGIAGIGLLVGALVGDAIGGPMDGGSSCPVCGISPSAATVFGFLGAIAGAFVGAIIGSWVAQAITRQRAAD
jgi:hypothetical protein